MRIVLFALIALCVLALGGLGVLVLAPAAPTPAAQALPPTQRVLAAARAVHAGSLLAPDDLAGAERPRSELPAGAYADLAELRTSLRGAMVRRGLEPGQVLTPEDVLRPGDHGFLAAVLAPGTRAISIAVDAVSGTAGLIWPGDRVDLILTQAMADAGRGGATGAGRSVAGEVVLGDVRVIAVDQQLIQGAQAGAGLTGALGARAARTVTLEVTSAQAERVAVAARIGALSAVVRAAEAPAPDGLPAQAARVVWAGDVSAALRMPASGQGATVRVQQGQNQAVEFRF